MFKTKLRVISVSTRTKPRALSLADPGIALPGKRGAIRVSYDGTVTIVQPLIERSIKQDAHELLAVFTPKYDQKPYDIIREYWNSKQQTANSSNQSAVGSALAEGTATTNGELPGPLQPPVRRVTSRLVAQVCARWVCAKHRAAGEDCFSESGCLGTKAGETPAVPVTSGLQTRTGLADGEVLKSFFALTRQSTTGALLTTAGCRNCRSRCRNSPGTMRAG